MRNYSPKWVANGTIAPCRFVIPDATVDHRVVQGTANARTVGVAQEGTKRASGLPGSSDVIAAEAGDRIDVFGIGDEALLECDAAVVRGAELESSADGQGLTAAGAGQHLIGAIALESGGAAGVKIRVLVVCYQKTI